MKNKKSLPVKQAAIRKNESDPCPFGLPIPFGCKHAGTHIDRMASYDMIGDDPSPEEKTKIGNANVRLLAQCIMSSTEEPQSCRYAAKIIENKDAVECNYYDSAPGISNKSTPQPSPFYAQIFSGVGLNGLYTYPIGYYADYDLSRNLFYGLMSVQGDTDLLCKIVSISKAKGK
jgi:hypothetical protein